MPSKTKVLVVAAWGYPPQWKKCVYRVRVTHEPFKAFLRGTGVDENLLREFRFTSCCSTLAILALLSKVEGIETRTLIFGSDSVVNPSAVRDGRELREEVRRRYEEWFDTLLRTSSEVSDGVEHRPSMGGLKPRFVILPGVGNYYGWRFEGSVDHLFLKAYYTILKELLNDKYSYVIADLTHGINFQTVSTLYALIAASLTLNTEDMVILMNSEPAVLTTKPCIVSEKPALPGGEAPQLNVLDVTKLQSVIKLMRIIQNAASLNILERRTAGKVLEGSARGRGIIKNLVKFINLLANGAVALTHPNTYYLTEKGGRHTLGRNINPCLTLTSGTRGNIRIPDYEPRIVSSQAIVKYGSANAYEALNTALPKILGDICSELFKEGAREDLVKYLSNAEGLFKRLGHTHLKLIVNQAKQELNNITKYVIMCATGKTSDELCQKVRQGTQLVDDKTIRIDSATLRELYENKARITNILAGRSKGNHHTQKWQGSQSKDEVRRKKKKVVDDITLRNLCAHAGLEIDLIEYIVVEVTNKEKTQGRITQVMYTEEIMEAIQKLSAVDASRKAG